MNRRKIRYAQAGLIAALGATVAYAFVKLYIMSQRADLSILLINVILFAGIAGVLIYLSKKERDLEEGELFRD